MVTNYYNASNNFSAPIRKEPKPFSPEHHIRPLIEEREEPSAICAEENLTSACCSEHTQPLQKAHASLKIDSDALVLLALLWILFVAQSDDKLLEIALIYLLLS